MEHTKGQWFINADIHGQLYVEAENSDRPFICDLQLGDEPNAEARAAILADARLIAAAPELLEALQGIIDIGKRDTTNPKYDGYYNAARAAISKAKGE